MKLGKPCLLENKQLDNIRDTNFENMYPIKSFGNVLTITLIPVHRLIHREIMDKMDVVKW